jgi:hypothetical protein
LGGGYFNRFGPDPWGKSVIQEDAKRIIRVKMDTTIFIFIVHSCLQAIISEEASLFISEPGATSGLVIILTVKTGMCLTNLYL